MTEQNLGRIIVETSGVAEPQALTELFDEIQSMNHPVNAKVRTKRTTEQTPTIHVERF
jgi:G3E family GTPase